MSTSRTVTPRRRRARRFGRLAESLCAIVLRLKGYRILARDFRVPVGEIDIVAQRGRTVAVVEVKARAGGEGTEVLTARQRRRIVRATEVFLKTRPHLRRAQIRFDLMVVSRWRLPQHLRNAWNADE